MFEAPAVTAVVFDLDDTLYPERDFVVSGFGAVAAYAEMAFGVPYWTGLAKLVELFASGVRQTTFDQWLAHYRLSGEGRVDEMIGVYREHWPNISFYPDVLGALTWLKQRHIGLGLVTDGYLATQRRKVERLGCDTLLDAVVYSDEWGKDAWKPSQRPFTAVLERLRASATGVVYVADNPLKDFLGARQAGMGTIRIQRAGGFHSHVAAPTAAHDADFTIQSLAELTGALSRIDEHSHVVP